MTRRVITAFAASLIAVSVVGGCVSKTIAPVPATLNVDVQAAALPSTEDHSIATTCGSPQAYHLASVVRVSSSDGESSGVVVARNYVLTAAHAVSDGQSLSVLVDQSYRAAQIAAFDREKDLALLRVETDELPSLPLSKTELAEDEPVWSVGFPLALQMQVNQGRYQQHVGGSIYASAATDAGASGGGLLRCDQGRHALAGMIRAYAGYWHQGRIEPIRDLSISVPSSAIVDFALNAGLRL